MSGKLCILCDENMCLVRNICEECKKKYPDAVFYDEEVEEEIEEVMGVYKNNWCFENVRWNRAVAFKHLNLKIVGGALGLDGWFEFGGKNWSHKKYMTKPNDIHFWLEDEKGNVYDYLQEDWNSIAKMRGVYCDFDNVELRGVSKEEIKRRYKIEYVPTTEKTYRECFRILTGGADINE